MVNQTSEYALRAVVFLAEARRTCPVTATMIADATGVPLNYLAKILHDLVRAGLLESSRGPSGGYRLLRAPQDLTVAEVLAPFGSVHAGPCILSRTGCHHRHPCPTRQRCRALTSALNRFVHTTHVADLAWRVPGRRR